MLQTRSVRSTAHKDYALTSDMHDKSEFGGI